MFLVKIKPYETDEISGEGLTPWDALADCVDGLNPGDWCEYMQFELAMTLGRACEDLLNDADLGSASYIDMDCSNNYQLTIEEL